MAEIDHLQERIHFFENSVKVKENISKRYQHKNQKGLNKSLLLKFNFLIKISESDRLKLEIELNRLINSDNAM